MKNVIYNILLYSWNLCYSNWFVFPFLLFSKKTPQKLFPQTFHCISLIFREISLIKQFDEFSKKKICWCQINLFIEHTKNVKNSISKELENVSEKDEKKHFSVTLNQWRICITFFLFFPFGILIFYKIWDSIFWINFRDIPTF